MYVVRYYQQTAIGIQDLRLCTVVVDDCISISISNAFQRFRAYLEN